MATYTTVESVDASSEEIQEMMVAKAHELFSVCDKEKKGFITKRDMQRLQTELPLSPEQLEDVFDSLDDDGNGYLTLEEFTEGFGSFLGLTPPGMEQQGTMTGDGDEIDEVYENEHIEPDPDSDHFDEMVTHIGAQGMFEDVDTIKSLWSRLRRDEPELLGNFEEFLGKVTGEMKRTNQDFHNLESALRNKSSVHDEEVRKLYEEMEQQIKLEKERVIAEEKAREKQVRDEMERELFEKDQQLQEMQRMHHEMQAKLDELNMTESETKSENEKLSQQKMELESMLTHSQRHLEDSKSYVNDLKNRQKEDKRDRVMAALQISEGIALERESLVKQLDMLRDMNRKLRDERDEAHSQRGPATLANELDELNQGDRYAGCDTCESDAPADQPLSRSMSRADSTRSSTRSLKKPLSKQGSILSEYFGSPKHKHGNAMSIEEDDIECDDELLTVTYHGNMEQPITAKITSTIGCGQSFEEDEDDVDGRLRRRQRAFDTSDSEFDDNYSRRRRTPTKRQSSVDSDFDSTSQRREPLGAQSSVTPVEENEDLTGKAPERVFKVVFVGDSGVGKSSFIHRFCNNVFKSTFSATIGVDFQVRNIRVDGHIVALQLWDTAGQERFRSITKQYFRKADGVLVMYDVTSESSYKNVRNWMVSVQDGVEEGTVLTLVGNKMDLVDEEDNRPVKTKDGVQLADEYGALFYETSSLSGINVTESLQAMSSLLREREDKQLEQALNLAEESTKKKSCCS